MRKKFLVLALPAFMVLTGCGARSFKQVNKEDNQPKVTDMREDTLAHEEIFGDEDIQEVSTVRTAPLRKTLEEASAKIGYQLQYDDNDTDSTADDKISIRFVAALPESLSGATAVWHRGLARPNGYEGYEVSTDVWKYKFSGETSPKDLTVQTKYLALNNGGSRVVANQGDFAGYYCFVIYTLMDIPYVELQDSYLAAYVSIGSDNSQGLAVKIERDGTASKNRFYFDPTVTGHFLEGTINGTLYDGGANGLYRESGNIPSGNYAWYEKVSLLSSDSFGSFYYGADGHFQFFGYSDFFDNATSHFDGASLTGYASPKADGKYDLFISSDSANHVYATKLYFVTFYANTTTYDNWGGCSGYYIHAFGPSGDYSGTMGSAIMSLVIGQEHLYSYELKMVEGKAITGVIFGFTQNGSPKQSVDISCSISSSGAYDINYESGAWVNDKMPASISAHS